MVDDVGYFVIIFYFYIFVITFVIKLTLAIIISDFAL